jgi:hypothetical protein
MLELLGIALVIVGTFVGFASARQVTAANAGVKIPWSGRIQNQPRSAGLLRGVAGALVIAGAFFLFSVLGAGVIALVFLTTASPLLVFALHNRRVAATGH